MLVLVTGASAGFGEAIARRFVSEGHQVILLARREERLRGLSEELGEGCVKVISCNVADIEKIKSELGEYAQRIDVLVNNAGLALGVESFDVCLREDFEEMIETNILGVVRLTHYLLPFMVERGSGHIINLGSIAGNYPYPGGNVYGGTKAFLKQFSLNLRADLVDKNIRVSNIEPGLCGGSEFSVVRFKGDQKRADELYENAYPLLPQDIAESVYWVASLPAHININSMELMPTTQAFSAFRVCKKP
ncbi:SDR family NAD(P)-dependent oxidoreductase [Helicobacter brantae]|uniref:NAD(P)-dependent oxidoreductase n=1 Tax=Helicobacter brantae TaxID=375927 RepID=A0A3D8IZY7_9HELI|nr:SDR family NAD(P)-dependent oxidoreductase [Helicobacter brantae]RDU70808.1 NAD(P)-dependent oxidoreductase [Helicobacter brantae]